MTSGPNPSDLTAVYTVTYDGVPKGSRWENRLVERKDGVNVVLKCEYDGLNRRIKAHIDADRSAAKNPARN